MNSGVDRARIQWGRVFSEFRLACEMSNAARYEVPDQQVFKDEEMKRLESLVREVQKSLNDWSAK